MKPEVHKGRGAVSTAPGRFAVVRIESDEQPPGRAPDTVLRPIKARTIISRNQSPDIPFDQSINPYQGCEHGCVYCYARPSHSYFDLSPGLDFETKIFFKPNAVERLVAAWQKPSYQCRPIAIGANTDPYQPAERELGITRGLLEAFLEHRHPVTLITKSALMARDLDLLAALAVQNLVSVAVSVPTADDALKRILEPRVPSAGVRFRLMSDLAAAGVPVTVLVAPVIPAVNDSEIESILRKSAGHGAGRAGWILLRLPHELKQIFGEWLEAHLPDRAAHVMSLVRQACGGRDYDSRFGARQRGRGPYAEMLNKRFANACRRFGLDHGQARIELDCSRFRPPGRQQLALGLD
ncbi:MAG: PA0069 family radical SAM protein [Gammaproteobacteria bacterium]|nr:PA0069 family radical SAM protein [Gammaproteobacteria bacterium]